MYLFHALQIFWGIILIFCQHLSESVIELHWHSIDLGFFSDDVILKILTSIFVLKKKFL